MEGLLNRKDFEIIRELGVGSFGKVELVRRLAAAEQEDAVQESAEEQPCSDEHSFSLDSSQSQSSSNGFAGMAPKLLAMKTVPLGRLNSKDKENALNEVRLLASLRIPNVIAYFGAFFDEPSQSLCILLEYADGGDLQQLLLRRKEAEEPGLPEEAVLKVACELLQGLQVMHASNVIHRDIKTANVFFANGTAKIGDLNVSKFTENGLCSTHTGTPYYTSPEVWKGAKYGAKCDIWSLGCVLYEMCALLQPFRAQDYPGLYRKVTAGIYPDLPAAYSAKLKHLIGLCLTVDEEMRPSAEDLLGLPMFLKAKKIGGEVRLVSKIKCPKALKLLNCKLPRPIESREDAKSPPSVQWKLAEEGCRGSENELDMRELAKSRHEAKGDSKHKENAKKTRSERELDGKANKSRREQSKERPSTKKVVKCCSIKHIRPPSEFKQCAVPMKRTAP